MNGIRCRHSVIAGLLVTLVVCGIPPSVGGAPLGTAFTYQGQVHLNGQPVSGGCDFQFSLYDAASSGAALGTESLAAVPVSNGLFTVQLDAGGQFGSSAFVGEERWLQIAVRCPSGSGAYTLLSPRQHLTATPYSRWAPAAGSAPWSGLTGMPIDFADGEDSDTLRTLACTTGQVAKRSGAIWMCAADDNTTYSAGSGLMLSGTQFAVTFGSTAGTVAAGNHVHGGQQWTTAQSPGLLLNVTALNGIGIAATASGTGPGTVGIAGGAENGVGVVGSSVNAVGVKGGSGTASSRPAPASAGVWGDSQSGLGVTGSSDNGIGVMGVSANATAVYGLTDNGLSAVYGQSNHPAGNGVEGRANGGSSAWGVLGASDTGQGVHGVSTTGIGVYGQTTDGTGVYAFSMTGTAVRGESYSGPGVHGSSGEHDAVRGETAGDGRSGVYGVNGHANGYGVFGRNSNRTTTGYLGGTAGVQGTFGNFTGRLGTNTSAVVGTNETSHDYGVLGATSFAGYFSGRVQVDGDFSVLAGHTKNFTIDHPLDPQHRYLNHFSVESSEVTNLYSGVAVLDSHGAAKVELPQWFEAINRDPRYQLTCIGSFAPVYVAEEISGNHFKIAGGEPGMKISWQVIATRNDPAFRRHPHPVEEDKPPEEQGTYLDPQAYSARPEASAAWIRHPEVMRDLGRSPFHQATSPPAPLRDGEGSADKLQAVASAPPSLPGKGGGGLGPAVEPLPTD